MDSTSCGGRTDICTARRLVNGQIYRLDPEDLHGLSGELISPDLTIAFYNPQVDKDGQATVGSFWRCYSGPGIGHGSGALAPSWDALGALDAGVTKGAAREIKA